MASITRFKEPLKFKPLEYRGLDTIPVFIEDGTPDSYDYFGLTRVPKELTAGRNLISFTGTRNLVPGSEIAIEVLDSNGDTVPVRTYDHIGEGNERVFAIEIGREIPEGDALISIIGVAKGKVGFDAQQQRDISTITPARYRDVFNIRWQKRLNCYPRRRNTDEIMYFQNPDITIEEIKKPYFQLHYNSDLATTNSRSLFTLCSTAAEGVVNTTALLRYEHQAGKYYIISSEAPDFGGFTQDMVGGTVFIPSPNSPFPSSFNSPVAPPSYNEIEDGDGTGTIDTGSQVFTNQGAYNTYISEVISPLRARVNSPHTTFQGFGRANQKEVFHEKFQESNFRLDFAQTPVSRSNPLVSGSNSFNTSYAKVTFNGLTPLVGDVTRVKTFIRNDQTVNDYFLVGDNPVFPQNLLIQSQSLMTRLSAGDFSPFGVSSSLDTYWSASSTLGLGFKNDDLSVFRQLVGNVNNPIPDSLQIGDSISTHEVGLLDGTNHILVDSTIDILHTKDQYYQVEFKCFGKRVNSNSPNIKIYMVGPAINDEGDDLGQMIGEISDIAEQELIVEQDPFNNYETSALKFTYKADATEFARLRFKIEQGLWFIFDVEVKPYYEYGYTPHFFDTIIPTTKANVGTVDALDFKFEFYNDEHNKAVYTADIPNIEFDNEFTFTATNVFFTSASVGTFIGNTPMGDDDWVRPFETQGAQAQFQPSLTDKIYHSGSIGVGTFHNNDVSFPIHVKKIAGGGNATIKLESVSSSILHLASDVDGAGLANQKNAFVLFDHNNATTSSIIGYSDTVNKDPGGADFEGGSAGAFVIHERHGKTMALGVGGTAGLIIAGRRSDLGSDNSVYIGHDDVDTGPFNPYSFGYELNISGSMVVSSGSVFYPQAFGPTGGLAANPKIIVWDPSAGGSGNGQGRLATASFNEAFAATSFANDDDWHIGTGFVSQSRYGTGPNSGRTVFIADSHDENSALAINTHILQVSQSGTGAKIRIEGLNTLGATSNKIVVADANGDLYLTASVAGGGDPQVDNDGGNASHAIVFSDDNTPSNTSQRLKAHTTLLYNPAHATMGSKLTVGEGGIGALYLHSAAGGQNAGFITPGIYFDMADVSSDPHRALSMERNIIVLGNNTQYGNVKITTGGTSAGYANRITTAEFSASHVNINTHMSVSGDISSSGVLFIDHISTGSHDTTESYISVTGSISVLGNVTASGDFGSNTGNTRLMNTAGGYIEAKSNHADYGLIIRDYNSDAWGNIDTNAGYMNLAYSTTTAEQGIFITEPSANVNRVGIGTSTPGKTLEVIGDISQSAAGGLYSGRNLYVGHVSNRIHYFVDQSTEIDLVISASDNDLKLMAGDDISLRPKNDLKITTGGADDEGIIHKDKDDLMLFESFGEQGSSNVGKFILHSKLHNPGMDTTAGNYYMRYNTTTNLISYITSNRDSKANIAHVSDSFGNAILDLKPVTFNYKNEPSTSIGGFIAEEAAEANTHFASYGPNYRWTNEGRIATVSGSTEKILKDDRIVPVDIQDRAILAGLVAKVQDLEARIKELEG